MLLVNTYGQVRKKFKKTAIIARRNDRNVYLSFQLYYLLFLITNLNLMKTKFIIGIIVVMAIASIAASPSPKTGVVPKTENQVSKQSFAGFSFFRIHRQGRGITSDWGMDSETGLSGYVVQRTYLDPGDPYGWENISGMPCTGARSYKWNDANVYAGFISYRIMATCSNGSEIYSDVQTIHVTSH